MKGAFVLMTVLVFSSMTEPSAARWAKNRIKAIQIHHFTAAVAQGKLIIQTRPAVDRPGLHTICALFKIILFNFKKLDHYRGTFAILVKTLVKSYPPP